MPSHRSEAALRRVIGSPSPFSPPCSGRFCPAAPGDAQVRQPRPCQRSPQRDRGAAAERQRERGNGEDSAIIVWESLSWKPVAPSLLSLSLFSKLTLLYSPTRRAAVSDHCRTLPLPRPFSDLLFPTLSLFRPLSFCSRFPLLLCSPSETSKHSRGRLCVLPRLRRPPLPPAGAAAVALQRWLSPLTF